MIFQKMTVPKIPIPSYRIRMSSPVDSIVAVIVRSINPEKIILFGSRGTDDARDDSDYDVCVIKSGVSHRRRCAMKLYEALTRVGVPVDIIVETPEGYEELKENPYLVYSEIEKNGKVIYERSSSG